jgi:hypothetical protein
MRVCEHQTIMNKCMSENMLESDAAACIEKYQADPTVLEPTQFGGYHTMTNQVPLYAVFA